jgi:hypothetical protein
MVRYKLIPMGVAVILAYCGVGLIKFAMLMNGTAGDFAGGVFLILIAIWMAFALLRRGAIR